MMSHGAELSDPEAGGSVLFSTTLSSSHGYPHDVYRIVPSN
jgi:hypothetical protein